MGDQGLLNNVIFKEGGNVYYGGNSQGKIIGMDSISFKHVLDNVFLVDGLKHNFISISQLCDMNLKFALMLILAMLYALGQNNWNYKEIE